MGLRRLEAGLPAELSVALSSMSISSVADERTSDVQRSSRRTRASGLVPLLTALRSRALDAEMSARDRLGVSSPNTKEFCITTATVPVARAQGRFMDINAIECRLVEKVSASEPLPIPCQLRPRQTVPYFTIGRGSIGTEERN